MDLWKGTRIS